MTATAKLNLELLANAAANQTLANTTFAQLNQLVQAAVVDKDLAAPPASPANEALYIVAGSPTGAWSGKAGQLAYWLTTPGAWQFIVPREGFLVHVNDEDGFYKFDGSAWVVFSSGGGGGTSNATQAVSSSGGVLNLSTTTAETLLLTTSENVTSISWPSGVAGQSVQRRLVVTQGGAGNYTLPSTTANWGSITVDGGLGIPQPATGVGSSTTYVLVNDNNTGWRMYLDQGPLLSFRRKNINGDFSVNQLAVSGTVVLTAGQYGHDGWKGGASGCTYTFSTSANVTTLTITAGSLQTVVDGLDLQSGTHTLSWVGTAQGKIGAGSYSASGVTGSATGGTNLTLEFNTGTLALVQFEPGTVATPYEFRSQTALLECQRYFETGFYVSFSATVFLLYAPVSTFKVEKRAVPTITLKSFSDQTPGVTAEYNQASTFIANRAASATATKSAFETINGGTATVGNIQKFYWEASARL